MTIYEDRLEVTAVAKSAWRVCDRSLPPDDASRVVGFLERTQGGFEAMRVIRGFDWVSFESFDDALAYFATQLDAGLAEKRLAEMPHPLSVLDSAAAPPVSATGVIERRAAVEPDLSLRSGRRSTRSPRS